MQKFRVAHLVKKIPISYELIYHTDECPPLVAVLKMMNPFHAFPPYFVPF
jgi:hypothetical protein